MSLPFYLLDLQSGNTQSSTQPPEQFPVTLSQNSAKQWHALAHSSPYPSVHSISKNITFFKARSHRQNFAGAFLERWKKFITARYRSPPFNRSWPPLRQRRIRSATADGPSYRSESFELHKILRAVRSGQFSAPAKFTTAPTTPSQSLAPLDASSWTLGSARPTQKSWTLDHRCFASFARAVIKRCTNFGGAVVSVLRADTGLLERCRALKQRSIAVMNFGLALVWRCRSGTRIWL